MPPSEESPVSDAAQANAAGTWSLVCLITLLGMVVALLAEDLEVWVLLPLLVGLVVILTRLWIGSPLLLATVLIVVWAHPEYWLHRRGSALQEMNVLFDSLLSFSLLVFVACHCRLLSLTRHVLPPDHRGQGRRRVGSLSTQPHVRTAASVGPLEFPVVLLTALLWTVFALFLAMLLDDLDNPFDPGLRANVWQAFAVLWVGSLVLAGAWALVSYLNRVQASPEESLQYLQDQLWLDTYRDQARLWRWLTWARLRFQRRFHKMKDEAR
jgi:hypothetical protein